MKCSKYILLGILFSVIGCKSDSVNPDEKNNNEKENTLPNVLLVIADDMGLDACPGYNIGAIKPQMPNLEKMMNSGLKFNNLWSCPTCSPTRGTILTGKYGFRTGVNKVGVEMSTAEKSIQSLLDEKSNNAYVHAVIGKWHLSNDINHPQQMGIDYFAGFMSGVVKNYYNWSFVENGTTSTCTDYTTTKFTDLAIDWLGVQTKPWFLWLAYNAPHDPFHVAPNNLHYQGVLADDAVSIENNPLPYYMSALEALDSEMGRLIKSLNPEELANTLIIFIGDNGTPNQVAQEYNSRRVKGSVYQGGVNVPMVISGKGVDRIKETEDALLSTTDLYATILDVCAEGTSEINDSKSFKSLLVQSNPAFREFVYTELTNDLGETDYAIRNATHKFVFDNGEEALYNLSENYFEKPNLLNETQLPLSNEDTNMKNELLIELEKIQKN